MADVERQLRIDQEKRCRAMADAIKARTLPGEGFALVFFDYGEASARGKNVSFVTTAARADTADLFRELAENISRCASPEGIVAQLRAAEAKVRTLELVAKGLCHALEAVGITEFDDPQSLEALLRRRLEGHDEAVAACRQVLAVIDAAGGSAKLSRGVDLGQVSWSVKCNDAVERLREVLAAAEG